MASITLDQFIFSRLTQIKREIRKEAEQKCRVTGQEKKNVDINGIDHFVSLVLLMAFITLAKKLMHNRKKERQMYAREQPRVR